jgi:hypothetical protein
VTCTGGAHLPIQRADSEPEGKVARPGFTAGHRPGVPDNYKMSLVQTCADAQSAIARARSLFGATGGIDVPNSAAEITDAAQTATAGRDRTLDMAGGAGVPAYRDMVLDRAVPPLNTAATSDAGLSTHLLTAATVTDAGAARLDSIAAQTRTISAAAPGARTAADQRAVLAALRGQMTQASQVVQTTQQQAGAAATQLRSLKYPKDAPASSGDGGVHALDDTIVGGQPVRTPVVRAAGFGAGGAPLDTAPAQPQPPAPAPGGSPPQPFLPAWQQALTSPPAAPPPAPPLPLPAGGSPPPPRPPLGQCVRQRVVPDLGRHMISDGFSDGLAGGLGGATGGAIVTPELGGLGGIPGFVLGFVGGFAKGAFEAPIKETAKGLFDCLKDEAGQ